MRLPMERPMPRTRLPKEGREPSARHLNELLKRLERVYTMGCAEIGQAELLLWYGRSRFTNAIWKDISERWDEMGFDVPLLVAWGDGAWVFVWGEGLTTSESSWMQEIGYYVNKRNGEAEAA
jgi:hypothetical protein